MICWVVNSMALKVLVGTMVLVGLIANWLPEMDAAARAYLDLSMADSLVVYATARGLNAVISVIQSVHLSFSLGAGVGLNLGEMLDPLNDLIERFSTFVLYGLAAIGLQKLLLLASGSLAGSPGPDDCAGQVRPVDRGGHRRGAGQPVLR
jgi:hypothetical protein